jgi:hypothetical protein
MKTLIKACAVFLFLAVAPTLLADTRYETVIVFYDSSGNEVGWRYLGCTGSSSSGTQTEVYSVESIGVCEGEVQPFVCGDQGLSSVPGCPSYFCATSGYVNQVNQGLIIPPC